MCKTAYQYHILYFMVILVPVALKQAVESLQELLRMPPATPLLIIVKHNRFLAALSSQINPHPRSRLRPPSGLMEHLAGCRICFKYNSWLKNPFLKYASQLTDRIGIPVVSVCGYRTPEMVEKAMRETKVSAVSFERPLVRETRPSQPLEKRPQSRAVRFL